ncbi:MAG: hypothetical protein ACOCUI_04475 [bacterium]
MKENQKFRTVSLRLATFLVCKNEEVIGIETHYKDKTKKEIIFYRTPELERLTEIYRFGKHRQKDRLVDAVAYEQIRQDLMEKFNEIDRW